MTSAPQPVRIGNAQAFWGDRADAAAEMLARSPELDYLTLDYLAEVSMSILALQRERDPAYIEQSLVFVANFLHNCELWDSQIGHAKHYTNFFGVTCLHDAPYMAAYECFESFAAFEEYLDVVYKLWEGSWDEDALRADKQAGIHADANKIHKINHVGPHFSVEGPHFVTPSPQRVPLLFQAGASPVGQRFSARNAEGVFISSPDPESARGLIDETRELAAGYGRDPYDVKFFQGLSLIVGRSTEEAREREAQIEELSSVEGVLCHILGDAGIDAGALPLDTPLSDLGEFRGVQGWVRWAGEAAGTAEPTIADLGRAFERSSRIVGSPTEIADKLEEWRDAGIDGVNVFHAVRPGTFEEIADLLFPELRRRGLLTDDKSGTLRHKLSGGGGDRVAETHPAAKYRSAFTDNSLADRVSEPLSLPARV